MRGDAGKRRAGVERNKTAGLIAISWLGGDGDRLSVTCASARWALLLTSPAMVQYIILISALVVVVR